MRDFFILKVNILFFLDSKLIALEFTNDFGLTLIF